MRYLKSNLRAISPVLAVLMMIAVAIAGSLVVYAWIMGYIDISTERAGEAIMIPSIANDPADADLLVYVQNIGEEMVQLDESECLYVDGLLVECTIRGVTVSDKLATLDKGETAMLRYSGGAVLLGVKIKIKVTTLRGTSAEKYAYPAGSTRAEPVLDHFEFDTIDSPQTSCAPFSITIRALDQQGDLFTGYVEANMLVCSGGEISPSATGHFVDGVWTGTVKVTGSATEVTITTVAQADPDRSGTSNTFDVELDSSLKLFGGGARWASPEGNSALYINRLDTWEAHHLTDGVDWGPWQSEAVLNAWRTAITTALEHEGFEVTYTGDVPEDLSGYDLVVFEPPWAVEPQHSDLVRDYLSNGGSVVLKGPVPCFFSAYCKDRWPYRVNGDDLSSLEDWFGASSYVNTNGDARLVVDDPFGTQLEIDEIIFSGAGSDAAVTDLDDDAQVIASWGSGYVFAFTHEYGGGRVYYQAEIYIYT